MSLHLTFIYKCVSVLSKRRLLQSLQEWINDFKKFVKSVFVFTICVVAKIWRDIMTNAASLSWRSKVFQANEKSSWQLNSHLENQKLLPPHHHFSANKIRGRKSPQEGLFSSHALITKVIDSSHRFTRKSIALLIWESKWCWMEVRRVDEARESRL